MKKLLYTFVLFAVFLVLIAQVDDDLSEEAASLIHRIDTESTSEAYLYLYGIFASEDENPVIVGENILEEYQKLDADGSYKIAEYPDSKKLVLPKGKEFCKSWEAGCLAYLFSSNISAETLLSEHSVLVARSNRFLDFEEYTTLSKPTIHELFPPYQYISAAERIKVLEAISVYKNGDVSKAIDSLLVQFLKLRKSMELQDSLIGKLVFLMTLSDIIDVLSIILSIEDVKVEMIPELSKSEKSFHMIAAREFGMSYHTFRNLDKHPEFFGMDGDFPGWITRLFYKPNMTINAITPIYYRLEYLAELSPADFAKSIKAEEDINLSTSRLRNYVGDVLIAISPEFDEYVARFSDFDAKLALFNQVHHLKYEPENMKNPYFGTEAPEESDGRLCFSGPLEDKRSLRCLRVKYNYAMAILECLGRC